MAAYEAGAGSYEHLADLFGVGRATVNRILRRYRETGDVAALPRGGHNLARIQPTDTERLARIVADMPGATLDELTEEWRKRVSTKILRSSMLRGLRNHGITFKKKAIVLSEQLKPHVIERRKTFAAGSQTGPAKKLVFLDEAGCQANMEREHTWAPASLRASAHRFAEYLRT